MTKTISGTYTTLVTLGTVSANPTTITTTGRLNGGLLVTYEYLDVMNAGTISNAGHNGVVFNVAGTLTNQSGALISGASGVVGYGYVGITVVNAGRIAASGNGVGLRLRAGGSVANLAGGTISGYLGVFGVGNPLTVVNSGTIAGSTSPNGAGVQLLSGGRITNQSGGVISGAYGITAYNGQGDVTVVNAGTISGGTFAVRLAGNYASRVVIDPGAVFSGTVSGGNTAGASYASTLELASGSSAGTISGLGTKYIDFAQVSVDPGARWTLAGTNTIAAGYVLANAGTLTNAGSLIAAGTLINAGSMGGKLTLAAHGVLTNTSTGTIGTSGKIALYGSTGGPATVVNAGVIAAGTAAADAGIDLLGGGTVVNLLGGTISGFVGIYGRNQPASVMNSGSIEGVDLFKGGSVTNASGGVIGGVYGVYGGTSAVTVVNAGSVAGTDVGILLHAGLAINQSGGSVSGQYGFVSYGNSLTLVNAGTVTGVVAGVLLAANAPVTNQSSGVIRGGKYGILADLSNATVVNAGTIAGAVDAVKFAAGYASRLVIDPGAAFVGSVDVGATAASVARQSVLELATGAAAGTLTGLGTQFLRFQQIYIDAGSEWTLTGSNTVAGNPLLGSTGITDNGTLTNAGTLIATASAIGAASGAVVLNSGVVSATTTGIFGRGITVVNAGTLIGGTAAVQLGGSNANRVIIDPGAAFVGAVEGSNYSPGYGGLSTLELASAASGGTLSGLGTQFIRFQQAEIDAGAQWTFTGSNTVISGFTLYAAGTLTNTGSLGGAVTVAAAGVFSNAPTGTVAVSAGAGVYAANSGSGTVVNAGLITSSAARGSGVYLCGSVTNQSGGTITGWVGINGGAGTISVTNAGTIVAGGLGVALAGGSLTNQSGGTISGSVAAVSVTGGSVVNAGTITGQGSPGVGVALSGGGSVTNQSGGTISGLYGISAGHSAGAVTVVNAGTISGTTDAVALAAGSANRLVIDPGADFSGTVDGGNTLGSAMVSTLELASGASAGTLSGLGTHYVDFAQITVDAGAQWTLSAANALIAGYTVTDAGTLTNAAAIGAAVTVTAGGALANAATGTISAWGTAAVYGVTGAAAAVVNAGIITNSNTSTSSGAIGLKGGGSVINLSGGTISGRSGVVALNGTTATVVNAGSIAASVQAVLLAGGGSVTNEATGTITSANDAIWISRPNGTVDNLGYIDSQYGIELLQGGVVINGTASGTNSSAYIGGGVDFGGNSAGTLTNYGTIGNEIDLLTGTIVNGPGGANGALIESTYTGINMNATGTIINSGQITASGVGCCGVRLGGGTLINLGSTSLIQGFTGVFIQGNGTVVNAGTIASNYPTGTALAFGGGTQRLIVDPGATFAGIVSGTGTTALELASGASAGTLSGFGTSLHGFSTLQFDPGAAWTVSGNDSASGLGTLAITGFAGNDTIDLTGFVAVSDTFANNALILTDASGDQATLDIVGPFSTGQFQTFSDGNGGTDLIICFAAGTMIETPLGEVRVENLKAGDLVATLHNGPRCVKWIGNGKVRPTPCRRTAATPVIVRRDALGKDLPRADLRVTKAHSLYIDDVLIPVEFLVNHRTIIWDDRAQELEIYHVELDSHDLLIANGVAAESYRDDGNRWLFENTNPGWVSEPEAPCAPVLTGGPVVDAIWRRLLDRSGPRDLPPMTEDPDLHLIVDGMRVDAERRGPAYLFRLPCRPSSVVIASREAVPAEFGIARDPRPLGVALRRVEVWQGDKLMLLDADDERLAAGFHAYEADEHLRWTDGRGALPAEAFARFDKGAQVMLHLGGTTLYPDEGERLAKAA